MPINDLKNFTKGRRIKILFSWLYKKIIHSFSRIFNSIWAIPVVFFFRFLSPWYHIKIGKIKSHRIGHFIADTLYQIIVKNSSNKHSLNLWAVGPLSNLYWFQLIKKDLHINKSFEHLYYWNLLIPGRSINYIDTLKNSRDLEGVFTKYPTKIKFNEQENNFGINWLKSFGWTQGEKFICLLSRDSKYLKFNSNIFAMNSLQTNFYEYHSYRNSDINTFNKSINKLIEKGYWVIRMGRDAEHKLNLSNTKFIDYPFEDSQSDFLDIWLFSNCDGCISTGTGIDYLSWAQGIPSLVVNYIPIKYALTFFNTITVPKKLYWEKNLKELTLQEYFDNSFFTTNEYKLKGIDIKDLSEDELLQAVIEFIDYLDGKVNNDEKIKQLKFIEKLKMQSDYAEIHGFINNKFKIGDFWLSNKKDIFFE